MANSPRKSLKRVPKEFFCPISMRFMKDPVISPSTKRRYDRRSIASLREAVEEGEIRNNDILPPKNESLLPDHDIRRRIAEWRREYTLVPPFSFISTPTDLETAVTALIDRHEHKLEDRKSLRLVRELSVALHGKSTLFNSKEGFLSVTKLIAGCPVQSTSDLSEWVRYSVAILANARDFNYELDLGDDQHKMLAVLDRGCRADIEDSAFLLGLLNLMKSLMASKEKIVKHSGIVRALSSYILSPYYHPFRQTKDHFDKLFNVILSLWGADGGLEQPRLSQAVGSLVWPLQERIDVAQYYHLLETISSRLKSQWEVRPVGSSLPFPIQAMTRAGLVSRIFQVLDYSRLSELQKKTKLEGWLGRGELTSREAEVLLVLRCFEMLDYLSRSSIGRLEIVRVINGSAYQYLVSFFSAFKRNNLADQKESHVLPALWTILNVVKCARYNTVLEKVRSSGYDKFVGLVNDDHPEVKRVAKQLIMIYNQIRKEERVIPQQNY